MFQIFYQRNCDAISVYIQEICFPRVVWSCWDSSKFPEDVEEMINVTKKALINFTYCLLTPSNISRFLEIDKFHKGFSELHAQGKADYVRICLLAKYGGIYIDSTTYVNSGKEVEWLFTEAVNSGLQVFGFPQVDESSFFIPICFLGSPESSEFMKKWKSEFDVALRMNFRKYVRAFCKKIELVKILSKKRCCPYLIGSIIFTKITYENRTLLNDVFLLPHDRDSRRLIHECKLNGKCVRRRLLEDPVARNHPLIKLFHHYRDGKKFNIG